MKKIGFIGVGVMGRGMVRNLMKHGFEVAIYTRTKEKALDIIEEGAEWCADVASCARGRDAVITIVGYPQDVRAVYLDAGGIIDSADAGAYLIDMTTTSPKLSVEIEAAARAKGLAALDAPVSGGDTGAKNGTLSIMVGGDEAAFEACRPVLSAMGTNVVYEGGPGSGQHTKAANQIAIAGTIAGACEAVAYAKCVGLDARRMLDTIGKGAAASWQLDNNAPKMLTGDTAPGFFIKHFIKDMSIAGEEAEQRELQLGVLSTVLAMYRALESRGLGDLGTQSIIQFYE